MSCCGRNDHLISETTEDDQDAMVGVGRRPTSAAPAGSMDVSVAVAWTTLAAPVALGNSRLRSASAGNSTITCHQNTHSDTKSDVNDGLHVPGQGVPERPPDNPQDVCHDRHVPKID